VPRFQPEEMFRVLEQHGVRYLLVGGLGATLHGSPLRTGDADICPATDRENLGRLAAALRELEARVRAPGAPEGLSFACDAALLASVTVLNLTTRFGDLDVCVVPAGTGGYDELERSVVTYDLDGQIVHVASLEDIIRSKEAANREKDRAAMPTLRELLARTRRG
jgi:hypothetical protein